MASTFSDLLFLERMVQGEQENTWGDITRDNHEKVEQAIAGRIGIALASSDYTLTSINGGSGSGSTNPANAILDCSGVISANIAIITPNLTKTYTIKNGTTGSFTVGIKTAAGSILDIPQGETMFVWCNGSDVWATISAISSGTIAQATNSLQLGGVVAANYAQLALKNSWTNPQIVVGNQRTLTADAYEADADTDGTIYIAQSEIGAGDITMSNPVGTPVEGQVLTYHIEQHGVTPVSVIWESDFIFTDDTQVDLTQSADVLDVFTAQYSTNLARWVVAGVALNFPRS